MVTAANSGVSPCLLATETFAPAFLSLVASSRLPDLHASSSAVSCCSLASLMSARRPQEREQLGIAVSCSIMQL
jgi:hypothetical protein